MIRLLYLTIALAFYRWAAREINRQHADVPLIALRIITLEHQQRTQIRQLRFLRRNEPTLSAVKNWL